jgi:hypothetical protein
MLNFHPSSFLSEQNGFNDWFLSSQMYLAEDFIYSKHDYQ